MILCKQNEYIRHYKLLHDNQRQLVAIYALWHLNIDHFNSQTRSGFTPPPVGGVGGVGGAGGGARAAGGAAYGGGAAAGPGAAQSGMRPAPAAPTPPQPAKRTADARAPMPPQHKPLYNPDAYNSPGGAPAKRKKRLADKILPQKVRDLVPESQAYMDLLAFERKLDATIMRKRLDIQEALKRPMKQKRKLRIFISNTFYPGKLILIIFNDYLSLVYT